MLPAKTPAVYFFSYRTAIRFHILQGLLKRGWEKATQKADALFSDDNLTLDDEISKNVEYKHLLANLVRKYCPDVMPITYCINEKNYSKVISEIIYHYYMSNGKYEPGCSVLKWILKPSMLNNGEHIKLFNNIEEVKSYYSQSNRLGGDHVLQQYITQPDLLEGKKYTFRIPVVVTNYAGIFVSKQGYVNISAMPFDAADLFQNKKMHITNYVLDGELANIQQRSTQELANFSLVFEKMSAIIREVMLALIKAHPSYLKPKAKKCFEIFGFDFTMDSAGRVWLLEINQGPDAPMFEENALKDILWTPFWEQIIEDFVLPIAHNATPKNNYASFFEVVSPSEGYSALRYYFSKLTAKQ